VREHGDGKTIGQIYVEKNRLDDLREEVAGIKEGAGLFLVEVEGVDTDGLEVLEPTSGEKPFSDVVVIFHFSERFVSSRLLLSYLPNC
jgi:hypothetical protein